MLREHNTSNDTLPKLPRVAIILTGKNLKATKKTQESVEEQSYKDVVVLHEEGRSAPLFFNSLAEQYEIYGLMSAGDTLASKDSLQVIVNKLSENKFIGGIYADSCVRENETKQEFYLPPHDHQTFSKLVGVFPVFFKAESMQEKSLDENLEHLYGHDILVKISNSFIVSHIPQLLFYLVSRQIDIQEDINYLKNVAQS